MAKLARLPEKNRLPAAAPDARAPRLRTRYYAFLSYSHKDSVLAEWLHRELEKFRVPHSLAGKLTANGVVPQRLSPIFRDQHDLSAGSDLAEEIKAALAASQFLVVLCSPTAAKSRWTNQEIESFKRTRPEGCVLAAVVAGEPFASDIAGREDEECFPPALRYKYDRRGHPTQKRAEPLAADFRDHAEGTRIAFLKLVAGMLGVGLDELVHREQMRRHRRLAYVAAASIAGMAVTSALAVTALSARNEAREQRREAEGLVSFMLGDLKDKLEPIGRLDALDGVGSRVLSYYKKEDASQLTDSALIQRAQALSLMGHVAYLRGNMDAAMRFYQEARSGTAEAIRRQSADPQRVYNDAQNVFWMASIDTSLGHLPAAEVGMREYKRLAREMVALDPNNMQWRMEDEDADVDLGITLYSRREFGEASSQFAQALQMIQALSTAAQRKGDYEQNLADTLAWLADSKMSNGQLDDAIAARQQQIALLNRLVLQTRSDVQNRQRLIPAEEALGRLYLWRGNFAAALQHLAAAVAVGDQLIPVDPSNTLWREYTVNARLGYAEALVAMQQPGPANVQVLAACRAVQDLLSRDTRYPSWRAGARSCWTMRGKLALTSGNRAEALQDAERAVATAKTVRTSDPAKDAYGLSRAFALLGDVQHSSGNDHAARVAWERSLSALPEHVSERPYEMEQHALVLQRLGHIAAEQMLMQRLHSIGYRGATL